MLNDQIFFKEDMYVIQNFFIRRPSDSTVTDDAAFKTRTFATVALALTTRLDLIFADLLDLILGQIWRRKICKFVQPIGSKGLLP
jgi:hypothetical protein